VPTKEILQDKLVESIRNQLLTNSTIASIIVETLPLKLLGCANLIAGAFSKGNKLILFGNGGSAADAQHIVGEFVGILRKSNDRPPLDAIALTTNTSILTSIVNDKGGDFIFERQIEACGKKGDVVIGISTSGNSVNIINGIVKANEMGMITIGLTGNEGGNLVGIVNVRIGVPSNDTPRIQETHILIGHILCDLVEQILQNSDPNQLLTNEVATDV
jgi:D-sedoheptulose 7-phosphate isomerase